MSLVPKKSIQEMAPYVNGKRTGDLFEQGAKVLKLDSNEASVPPAPRVIGALVEFIQKSPLQWYPDTESIKLRQKLSHYVSLPMSHIQTFNGSDHALETVCRTYLEPGDEVVLCMPTYDHFRVYAQSCDAKLVPVFGASPFVPKMEALLKACTQKTKIVYIVNPNNPTGILYSHKEICHLLSHVPDALVIVDEAYFEFCGETMASLVLEYSNLAVTRSFSKAFGMAGLRCGYLLTQPQNLEFINKVRIGKNINSLAQIAACAALDDVDYMSRYVTEVRTARSWLSLKMKNLGLTVVKTPANYILVEVKEPKQVQDFLENHLVYTRDRSILPQLEGYIRITIGHQFMMERFWLIFKQIPSVYLFGEQKVAMSGAS